MGTDDLAPEMFIGVDFWVDYGGGGGHGGRDRRFRLDGQCGSALVAEFRVLLVLLVAPCAGFHPSESNTIKTPPG